MTVKTDALSPIVDEAVRLVMQASIDDVPLEESAVAELLVGLPRDLLVELGRLVKLERGSETEPIGSGLHRRAVSERRSRRPAEP